MFKLSSSINYFSTKAFFNQKQEKNKYVGLPLIKGHFIITVMAILSMIFG